MMIRTALPRHTIMRLTALLILMLAIGGCASTSPPVDTFHPVFPAPDAPQRIEHQQTIRGAADMGKAGFFDSLGALIAGASRQILVRPQSIAVDDRHLYIADQELQCVHVLQVGSNRSSIIERAGDIHFVSPVGVLRIDDRLLVSDSSLSKVLIFSAAGKYMGELRHPDGFKRPTGMAYDAERNVIFVVDTLAHEVCRFDQNGTFLDTWGEPGTLAGQFNYPTYIATDRHGRLFVTDSLNFRVQVLDAQGQYLFEFGKQGDATGHLGIPKGVAVDSDGHIYIVDSYF